MSYALLREGLYNAKHHYFCLPHPQTPHLHSKKKKKGTQVTEAIVSNNKKGNFDKNNPNYG